MPRHTTIGGKKGRDTRRTNRYNLFCVFIREWVARGDANGGSATTMSRIASPYWEVLTDEERAYWRRRAREIYRPTPQDIANAGARGHRFGLTEHDGGGSAVVRLIEFGTPSREHFREWYSELTQSGMLDVISDDLVSTTAFVRGLKRSRSTRRWQDDVHLCSASQPVEPREASPSDLDTHSSLPTSFPSASWPAPTSGIHGDPPIVAPAGFDGHGDPWRPSFVPYLTPPSIVSPSPSELPWPAFIAHDFATVDHYREASSSQCNLRLGRSVR
ncbi:hypothetical protein ACG7TL_008471 [Trametes sanguinea]